jgi:hypothetical protein
MDTANNTGLNWLIYEEEFAASSVRKHSSHTCKKMQLSNGCCDSMPIN